MRPEEDPQDCGDLALREQPTDGNEGGGIASTIGDATWIHTSFDTSLWSSPGGDFLAIPSATVPVGSATGVYTWSGAGLAADCSRRSSFRLGKAGASWHFRRDRQYGLSARGYRAMNLAQPVFGLNLDPVDAILSRVGIEDVVEGSPEALPPEATAGQIDADVDRLWRERPWDVAFAYQSRLKLFPLADEPTDRRPSVRISDMHSASSAALGRASGSMDRSPIAQ